MQTLKRRGPWMLAVGNGSNLGTGLAVMAISSIARTFIAAFRAHQERFNRERHEYFNATLARLRAEINELPEPARRQAGSAGNGRRPDLPDPSRMPAAGAPPQRRPEGLT